MVGLALPGAAAAPPAAPEFPRISIDSLHAPGPYAHSLYAHSSFADDLFVRRGTLILGDYLRSSLDLGLGLGINVLTEASVLPLGPNSVYELNASADAARRRATGSNRRASDQPTTADIPRTVLPKITKVKAQDFDRYLEMVGPQYAKIALRNQLTEASLQAFIEQVESSSDHLGVLGHGLALVPKVYFEDAFQLDNPRVFEQVVENRQLLASPEDTSTLVVSMAGDDLASNTRLQEQLSLYLDLVEIHLIHEISNTLDLFFSAIGDVRAIEEEVRACSVAADAISTQLALVETQEAREGQAILSTMRRVQNVGVLERAVARVQQVVEAAEAAQRHLDSLEHRECLSRIEEAHAVLTDPALPLSQVAVLAQIETRLAAARELVAQHYAVEFVDLLSADLERHCDAVSKEATLWRLAGHRADVDTLYSVVAPEWRQEVAVLVEALARSGGLEYGFQQLKTRIMADAKLVVRRYLPTEDHTTSSLLSTNLKQMTPLEFGVMVESIFSRLAECLRRMTAHQKVLLDEALRVAGPLALVKLFDILQTVQECVEVVQGRMMKIMAVRRAETSAGLLKDFLAFYLVLVGFVNECELITGGMGTTSKLQDFVVGQTKAFVAEWHARNLRTVEEWVEKETWKENEGARELAQAAVERIVTGKEAGGGEAGETNEASAPSTATSDETAPAKLPGAALAPLAIGSELFHVVTAVSRFIELILDYVVVAARIPSQSATVEYDVYELVEVFNSRAQQAVLGTGATRTAGLKHITTKHLALVAQALDALVATVGVVQTAVRKGRTGDARLDLVLETLRRHQREVFGKLVAIMGDRVAFHAKEIGQTDWGQAVPPPGQCHEYMAKLVKETVTILLTLTRYLPEIQVLLVMLQIFDRYKRALLEEYTQVVLRDGIDKAYMMKDVDYFRAQLLELTGYGNVGVVIWENVNSMPTEEERRMEQP